MRILKKMIWLANKQKKIICPLILKNPSPKELAQIDYFKSIGCKTSNAFKSFTSRLCNQAEEMKATKNIAKNYAQAICSFIASPLSDEHVNITCDEFGISPLEFRSIIKQRRQKIKGLEGFRSMLVIENYDSVFSKIIKKCFQALSIIFIKYYSVKWIYNSKLTYKAIYIKYRFRMLRRVQEPELFHDI